MRVFISGLDGYVATVLIKRLQKEKNEEEEAVEIVGSREPSSCNALEGSFESASRSEEETLCELACSADVVVLNLYESLKEAAIVIKALKSSSKAKSLILVSTLLTWGKTSRSADEDFTEDEFNRRKPATEYLLHKTIESQVLALAHDSLSTTVLATGFLYGGGENIFHDIFRNAWLGRECVLPGSCENRLPTLHVDDLCKAICATIESPPSHQYVIAVDESHDTLETIATAVFSVLQPDPEMVINITEFPEEEDDEHTWKAFAVKPVVLDDEASTDMMLQQPSWHQLMSDLAFNASESTIQSLVSDWTCKGGMVSAMNRVVEEFKKYRDLRTIKTVVMGPPCAGKSVLAKILVDEYKLPCVTVDHSVEYVLEHMSKCREIRAAKLEEHNRVESKTEEQAEESEEKQEIEQEIEKKDTMEVLGDAIEQCNGILTPQLQAKAIRCKLLSPACLNQGYVLDCSFESRDQLKDIFGLNSSYPEEESEEKTEQDDVFILDTRIAASTVVSVDTDDETLRNRAVACGRLESEFEAVLAAHRKHNDDSILDTPLSFFETICKIETLVVADSQSEMDDIRMYCEKAGMPFNYHPTLEEVLEKEAKERVRKLAIEDEERRSRIANEQERKYEEEKHAVEMETFREKTQQHEAQVLEARSEPLRKYLMEHVMPALSQGLVKTCKEKPDDPVDFLAEFLFSFQN